MLLLPCQYLKIQFKLPQKVKINELKHGKKLSTLFVSSVSNPSFSLSKDHGKVLGYSGKAL